MSINLEISENLLQNDNSICDLHYIPASTNGGGAADIDNQFNQFTKKDENGSLSNSLRGYPLKGEQFRVPNGYSGICFQESQKPMDEGSIRTLKAFGRFDDFTYWNYDKIPSNGDPLKQALQIIDISEQLCEPVSMAEIEAELNSQTKKES